jgi:Arc/MetJ-type ribon-helix-helix transcriptional regulator
VVLRITQSSVFFNTVHSMSYQFPQDIEERVRARMSDGLYQTEDEVIREAMDALDQLEQDRLVRWEERNRIAIRQSQDGLSKPLDDKEVLARLRERLCKEGIVD